MSEARHTRGPWHVFSVYAQHEVRTPTDTLVAVANSRDDARLIAATPDLLHAAQKVEAAWNTLCSLLAQDDRIEALEWDAMQKLRAAIARATGAAHV